MYSYDKYYSNDLGELAEIDDSVVSERYSYAGREYSLANAADSSRYRFAEDAPAVLVDSGARTLAFETEASRQCRAVVGGMKEDISGYTLSGKEFVAYKDAFEHTDLVYEARHGQLKEYIVLNDASAPNTFGFRFTADGCTVKREDDGTIGFYGADGEPVFELGMLYAVDSAGAYTEELAYNVTEAANGSLIISVSLSEAYSSDPERVYPILIDPSVVIKGSSNVKDAFVSSLNDSTNYGSSNYLRTGWDSNYNVRRSYIKFDIPTSVMGKAVTLSYMSLKMHDYGNAPTVKAYRVTGSWSASTITWNNKPVSSSTDVSEIAEPKTNYGFMVKDATESGLGNWATFYSANESSTNSPQLRIRYVNYLGSRSYQLAGESYQANCMGYALEYLDYITAEDLSRTIAYYDGFDLASILDDIRSMSQLWMTDNILDNNWMTIDSYDSDIPEGWFRVALRVGIKNDNGNGVYDHGGLERWDYHWWYQTKNVFGDWAEKRGPSAAELIFNSNGLDPAASAWHDFYSSDAVYYAIKDIRTINWP